MCSKEPPANRASLEVRSLCVSFEERVVLNNLSLHLEPGTRCVVLGANGSGKTTLLRSLAGALRPDSGEIKVGDTVLDYSRAGLRAHRQNLQLVTQNPDDQLFATDVMRDVSFGPMNLGLPEVEVRSRVANALRTMSLTDLADRPLHELSFGQRKRVTIAGALAMSPAVILLDEPTAGLDPVGVQEMTDAINRLNTEQGTTVLLCTHDVDFALRWADVAAVLVAGVVVAGSPNLLLADEPLLTRARLQMPQTLYLANKLGLDPTNLTSPDDLLTALGNKNSHREQEDAHQRKLKR